jgi:hypothetical protein
MTDGLSTLYQDLLGGNYDCVDRIVLNAYFRMGHDPGGFRVWWRALTGSDETLENVYPPQAPRPSSVAECALGRQTPEVGAECPNWARSDLRGGRSAMGVPTANA